MTLPAAAYLDIAPSLRICRLLNGLWQLSGAHGPINPPTALPDMFMYHDAGFTTWDLADHYGPAEDFIATFRRGIAHRDGEAGLANIQAFTKWVPRPGPMTRPVVEAAINTSLRRMEVRTLDMLQFHWWEYGDLRYLNALEHLADLQAAGKIRYLALTNFDTEHMAVILKHGVRIVSNQVQFSVVDCRPDVRMVEFCAANDIWLLAYGTLCGGLLSEKYLRQPEPRPGALNTPSLRKYKQMIDAWGGWALFQDLLAALDGIARRHSTPERAFSIANVAARYILDKPRVAGVIIGARLGLAEHRADNAAAFDLVLDAQDHAAIATIDARAADLFRLIGDCGDEYRH
jgi:aryl-alcohol dehydrogenase-like predicted oxidoreductase